ncbi:MAG: phosphatase PAP2 family protein [Fibrobacter sp.]|jgi:undecaprenyl-diphosphatase|nr:phosphatase PAP2 family protein [Fibrobacter sp.]
MLSKFVQIDQRIALYLKTHRFSNKTNRCLKLYVRLGDGYIWAVFAALLLYKLGWEHFLTALWQILISLAVSLALYWTTKLSTKRQRPFIFFTDIEAEVPPLDKYSFPSGHTMNNLAVASTIFYLQPSIGWFMLILPITWGLLRVYFGVHWFFDIVIGALLGVLSFFIAHFIWSLFL